MKILIYDSNIHNLEKFCNMLSLYPIKIIVDKSSKHCDIIDFITKYSYDKVFIDYDNNIGKKILGEILQIKPKQKIFLLSQKDECPVGKNCEFCKSNYKKHIIIKPLSQDQLTKIISRKFTCESEFLSKKEFILEKIKKEVQLEYPYLKFDYCKNKDSFLSENLPTSALVFITNLLNQYEINFHVTHKNQIIIE